MKNYSEMTNSVLKRAAAIKEEQHEKARKTRKTLTAYGSAAIMLALVVGAVLLIKPFGERGDGGQYAQGVKNTAEASKVTPECMDENPNKNTAEPTPSGSPSFITESTRVKSYEEGDKLNTELALSMLRSNGYIEIDTGEIRINYYNTAGSVLRNCTSDYILEHAPNIELFQDNSSAYFLRLDDKLYRYDSFGGWHHNMCLWDYDKNGVDDLVLMSEFGSGLTYLRTSVFDMSSRSLKEIICRNIDISPAFRFDSDGESIFIDGHKVEYADGEFYIGGVRANEYDYSPTYTEPPLNTPEPTPSGSNSPSFITETTYVKTLAQSDFYNLDLFRSMLESDGYFDERTGELRHDYISNGNAWRNHTPECIRIKTDDIDLFDIGSWDNFIRIKDKLYCFKGSFINMCLWDHDNNGIDDLVFYRDIGSGNQIIQAIVLDLNTNETKGITLKKYYSDSLYSAFGYDGENIYFDRQKVEYADGEFYIGGVRANEYDYSPTYTEPPLNTPLPTPFTNYAYQDILLEAPDDFIFRINWGVNGESSYSSETGRLVKTTNATHPEDYVTELFLDKNIIDRFYTNIMYHIDIFSLPPDNYDPINDPASESRIHTEPYETVMLSVEVNGNITSVVCPEIPLGDFKGYCYEAYTFYNLGIRYITDAIMATPEWQALPQYEFFYE